MTFKLKENTLQDDLLVYRELALFEEQMAFDYFPEEDDIEDYD